MVERKQRSAAVKCCVCCVDCARNRLLPCLLPCCSSSSPASASTLRLCSLLQLCLLLPRSAVLHTSCFSPPPLLLGFPVPSDGRRNNGQAHCLVCWSERLSETQKARTRGGCFLSYACEPHELPAPFGVFEAYAPELPQGGKGRGRCCSSDLCCLQCLLCFQLCFSVARNVLGVATKA